MPEKRHLYNFKVFKFATTIRSMLIVKHTDRGAGGEGVENMDGVVGRSF